MRISLLFRSDLLTPFVFVDYGPFHLDWRTQAKSLIQIRLAGSQRDQ